MKSILSLGAAFILLISTQVYLEKQNRISPEGTDSENDSIGIRYRLQNGKIYYLSQDNVWTETRPSAQTPFILPASQADVKNTVHFPMETISSLED